jgi:hypothetical protein
MSERARWVAFHEESTERATGGGVASKHHEERCGFATNEESLLDELQREWPPFKAVRRRREQIDGLQVVVGDARARVEDHACA